MQIDNIVEFKISENLIDYDSAIEFMKSHVYKMKKNQAKEMLWFLEHHSIFTAGTSAKETDQNIKNKNLIRYVGRGGQWTWHGPGQTICYFVLDLNKRNKDIRKFILNLEKIIIKTLEEYKIKSFSDRKNIGIWVNHKNKIKKVGAIGIKVKNWIAYHGFSININNELKSYKKIIPCGVTEREDINLKTIKDQEYNFFNKKIVKNFIKYLKV